MSVITPEENRLKEANQDLRIACENYVTVVMEAIGPDCCKSDLWNDEYKHKITKVCTKAIEIGTLLP